MSGTTVMNCECCGVEWDCIYGLCQDCSDYNYKLQKQSDLLTLGLLQEKNRVTRILKAVANTLGEIKHTKAPSNHFDRLRWRGRQDAAEKIRLAVLEATHE